MVRYAFDKGVRYFDTARVYSESESIVGKGLKDVRKEAFIATKIAVFSPDAVRKSLETSLEELLLMGHRLMLSRKPSRAENPVSC